MQCNAKKGCEVGLNMKFSGCRTSKGFLHKYLQLVSVLENGWF